VAVLYVEGKGLIHFSVFFYQSSSRVRSWGRSPSWPLCCCASCGIHHRIQTRAAARGFGSGSTSFIVASPVTSRHCAPLHCTEADAGGTPATTGPRATAQQQQQQTHSIHRCRRCFPSLVVTLGSRRFLFFSPRLTMTTICYNTD